ncbi:deoxyribose-phosphate aldolase [soil metagenome]
MTDAVQTARTAISLLDLTNLNDVCTAADIDELIRRAHTPHGEVAALCIWPQWIEHARRGLGRSAIRIATVANFPHGGADAKAAGREVAAAFAGSADEADIVIPYRAILNGEHGKAASVVAAARAATPRDKILKVILETGELKTREAILLAADIALGEGADFLKTSTGKVPVNATLEAAELLMTRIKERGGETGFKAAGGIRTTSDAGAYLDLAVRILGAGWISPRHFRFGASGVLADLIATIDGKATTAATGY